MRSKRYLAIVVWMTLCASVIAALTPSLFADDAIDFNQHVAPILIRHCSACHNPGDLSGSLNLLDKAGAIAGGESAEPAFVPGKAAESPLVLRIESGDMPPEGKGRPVPAADLEILKQWIDAGAEWPEGRVLSPFEFTTDARAGRDWWSLQPPVRPEPPQVDVANWPSPVRNPIDAFVARQLKDAGLVMSPEADRATLIRRAMLDLLGLPPTPEEVQAFVADKSSDAYEKLIDRLLSSPHYGERWARHWLDVVRFAESTGFETNVVRPNAWPYRDYVIRSLNEDKPYNQFVLEQLAGDQVGAPIGTAFLVAGPYDQVKSPDIELTRMQRLGELDDMVSTTSTAFLGLTVGCAKCHDHKFDAISQLDYYGMQAMFAGVQHGERSLESLDTPDSKQKRDELQRQLVAAEQQRMAIEAAAQPMAQVPAAGQPVQPLRPSVHAMGNVDRFAPLTAKYVRFTIRSANVSQPCIDELEIFTAEKSPRNVALAKSGAVATASSTYGDGVQPIHQLAHVNDGLYGNSRSWISNEAGKGWIQIELPKAEVVDRIAWARDREGVFSDRLATDYVIEVAAEPGAWQVVATSADRMPYDSAAAPPAFAADSLPSNLAAEYANLKTRIQSLNTELARYKPQTAYVGNFVQPSEPTYRLHRGEPMQRREEVAPATIKALGRPVELPTNAPEAERRLALAKWIADDSNPLTARVMVNRIWHYHFGRGLMLNPSDFGFNGGKPSHPELLDWLATEFMANGWHPKHIHRLIMLSSTYRQSSANVPQAAAVDGGNVLLWRYSGRRLEAEPIRDIVLSVSGTLDLTMGGPGFDLFEPNSNYVKVYIPKQTFTPAEFRRMIYQQKPRMQPDGTFGMFDCPDSAQPLAKRNISTTSLQALSLLNSPFVVDQAGRFAARLQREAPDNVSGQVQRAFWIAFGRAPDDAERQAAEALVAADSLSGLCRAILNSSELVFIQ